MANFEKLAAGTVFADRLILGALLATVAKSQNGKSPESFIEGLKNGLLDTAANYHTEHGADAEIGQHIASRLGTVFQLAEMLVQKKA